MTTVWLLVLLTLANGSPVIAARLFGSYWTAPMDGGHLWRDGRPILGPSKTWRGLVAGVATCTLAAPEAGYSFGFGAVFGVLALLGDAFSSFIKRRMGLPSSARASGLDQLPEAVFPALFAWLWLSLQFWQVVGAVLLFVAGNMLLSPLLFRLGIRRQPH